MSPNHLIYLVIICATALRPGNSQHEDYFTSVGVLGKLMELEQHLLHNLRDYVDQEVAKSQQIAEILEDFESENVKALTHPREYFGTPINVFKTIKRSVVDLRDLGNYIDDGSNEEFYRDHVTVEGILLPDREDFKGAVLGIDRLQATYKLDTSELSDGRFYGTQQGSGLSASDVFYMAVDLFQAGKFERSLEWLLRALEKFSVQPGDKWEFLSKPLILEWICAAALEAKKLQVSSDFSTELLKVDPGNKYALQNEAYIEAQAFEARNAPKYRIKPTAIKEPSLYDLYTETCRGERRQTPTEKRPLRCMYVNNGHPFLKIAPFKMEQLNLDPFVAYFHEAIYENEIQKILNVTNDLRRSEVGESSKTAARTSKNSWLDYEDHQFLIPLAFRIMHMTNLSGETFEELQVVNYGIGGHYVPHFDFSMNPDEEFGPIAGNRMATALFYLSDVEFGGATAFPLLKLAVKPIRGSMVFWYNIFDSSEPDKRTRHAACPVLKGSKWIVTEWIHERGQEFLRPCGLQPPSILAQDSQKKM